MAPSDAWKPIIAFWDGPAGGAGGIGEANTFEFQPVMNPDSLAKMNVDGADVAAPVRVRPLTTKLPATEPANTCPVGAPLGMFTLNAWPIGMVPTSPVYNSLRS